MVGKKIFNHTFIKKKKLKSIKKQIFSSEKLRNSGNCIYVIILTRSLDMIFNPVRYNGN